MNQMAISTKESVQKGLGCAGLKWGLSFCIRLLVKSSLRRRHLIRRWQEVRERAMQITGHFIIQVDRELFKKLEKIISDIF